MLVYSFNEKKCSFYLSSSLCSLNHCGVLRILYALRLEQKLADDTLRLAQPTPDRVKCLYHTEQKRVKYSLNMFNLSLNVSR